MRSRLDSLLGVLVFVFLEYLKADWSWKFCFDWDASDVVFSLFWGVRACTSCRRNPVYAFPFLPSFLPSRILYR